MVKKIEVTWRPYALMLDLYEATERLRPMLTDSIINDKPMFAEITKGQWAGSIVEVEFYKLQNGDYVSFRDAKAFEDQYIYFDWMNGNAGEVDFDFGTVHDLRKNKYGPLFLEGYEGGPKLVYRGKEKPISG